MLRTTPLSPCATGLDPTIENLRRVLSLLAGRARAGKILAAMDRGEAVDQLPPAGYDNLVFERVDAADMLEVLSWRNLVGY